MLHSQDRRSALETISHELAYLHQRFIGRYGHIDEHLLDASIEDAILHYLAHPERFASDRGIPFEVHLEMWTRSYLYRRLRKEKRHRQHEKAIGVAGEIFEEFVSEMSGERSIYIQRDREELENQREALDAILARLNLRDRAGAQLLRDGASLDEWVQYLRIEHLTRKEQQHKVNVEKERLTKKLKRRAQKMQGGVDPRTESTFGQPVSTQVENANHG